MGNNFRGAFQRPSPEGGFFVFPKVFAIRALRNAFPIIVGPFRRAEALLVYLYFVFPEAFVYILYFRILCISQGFCLSGAQTCISHNFCGHPALRNVFAKAFCQSGAQRLPERGSGRLSGRFAGVLLHVGLSSGGSGSFSKAVSRMYPSTEIRSADVLFATADGKTRPRVARMLTTLDLALAI